MPIDQIVYLVVAAVAAGIVSAYLLNQRANSRSEVERMKLLEDAKSEAKAARESSRSETEKWIKGQKDSATKELREGRSRLKENEDRLSKREDSIERKMDLLNKKEVQVDRKEESIIEREAAVGVKEAEASALIEREKEILEKVASLSQEEARKTLLERIERDLDHEGDILVSRMIERVEDKVELRAKDILATTIQRLSSSYCQESTVSSIELPNDDMKGRIIGREGRNIRAIEKTTGVDVIVDDTPGVITLSCFDPIRREMGCRAMQVLIKDGRIHPTRIEEVVAETKKEINEAIQKTGVQVSYDLDMPGIHPKLVTLLGRLRFRTSYGQNVLGHCVEVSNLCGMLAGELNIDVPLAKRCGLFHDIGKAVDHQFEGGHPEIGATLLRRYDEAAEVCNSAASHHNDVPQESVFAVLTQAADSISGSRPGARGESLERYVQRLEKLETLVASFGGVKAAQAIQAGREVRVFVNAQKVNDKKAVRLCHEIAKEIEGQLTYPGEIKITLIRETRVIEYAR